MRLFILALEGVFDTGLTAILDAFSIANSLSTAHFGGTPRFDVTTVGVRRNVRTAHGLTVPVEPIKPASRPDWVLIPAVLAASPEDLAAKLDRADMHESRAQLLKWSARGTRIGAACMGTFILAETGASPYQSSIAPYSFDNATILATVKAYFPKIVAIVVWCQNLSLSEQQGDEAFMTDAAVITLADLTAVL